MRDFFFSCISRVSYVLFYQFIDNQVYMRLGNTFYLTSSKLTLCYHSRTTCGNICWSIGWINPTSLSKGVGLGSPFAACSVHGDLTLSVHIVNNFSYVSNIERMYVFVSEDHMLDWHSCQTC